MSWTNADPGYGSLSALESSLTPITDLTTGLENGQLAAGDAKDGAGHGVWEGGAAEAWRASVTAAVTEVPDAVEALDAAGTAVSAYVGEVNTIKGLVANEHQKAANANAVLARPIIVNPLDPAFAVDKVARALAVQDLAEVAHHLTYVLSPRRTDADNALAGALRASLPATWSATQAVLSAHGITGVADLTPAAVTAAMLDLANALKLGALNEDEIAALSALFDAYGENEAVMSDFFLQFGGTDLVLLIDTLGYQYVAGGSQAALDLAWKLRAALSVGSANWLDVTAIDFASEMLYGSDDSGQITPLVDLATDGWLDGRRSGALAFLFADPQNSPMGEEFTVAVATSMDYLERTFENADGLSGMTIQPGAENPAIHLIGGGTLAADLPALVFETLGDHYHDAAFEFITGDEGRIGYWYGERSWYEDGGVGAADLWLGAQQVDGGPWDPEPDPAIIERNALLASEVLWALSENEWFAYENLIGKSAADFAASLAPHLDGIAADMLVRGGAGGTDPAARLYELIGGGTGFVPYLSAEVFANFLGNVGAHDAGAEVITAMIDDYQTLYTSVAVLDPAVLTDALDRAGWLEAALDGSGIGARLDSAERHDADLQASIDAAKTVVGLIPLPVAAGLKAAGLVLGAAEEQLIGILTALGKKQLISGVFGELMGPQFQLEQVTAEMSDLGQAQSLEYTVSLASQLNMLVEPPLALPPMGSQTADEWAISVSGWWEDTAGPYYDEQIMAITGQDLQVDQLVAEYQEVRDANIWRVVQQPVK
jgi:hypothetical protein